MREFISEVFRKQLTVLTSDFVDVSLSHRNRLFCRELWEQHILLKFAHIRTLLLRLTVSQLLGIATILKPIIEGDCMQSRAHNLIHFHEMILAPIIDLWGALQAQF